MTGRKSLLYLKIMGIENDKTKPFKCTELTDASPQVKYVTSKPKNALPHFVPF